MVLLGAVGALLAGACVLAALRSKRVNSTERIKKLELN